MTDWLVLSNGSDRPQTSPLSLVEAGMFVLEFALPLDQPTVLLHWQGGGDPPRTLGLLFEPTLGLVLMMRLGQTLRRHVLGGPLPEGKGTARLCFRFDCRAGDWSMSLEKLHDDAASSILAAGANPIALNYGDYLEIARMVAPCQVHPAVHWFGLAKTSQLPAAAPWIGPRTPVETSRGMLLASHLQVGDRLISRQGDPVRITQVATVEFPARGSFAPVLLRAPFLGLQQDILVSSGLQIHAEGAEVEYLFNRDRVCFGAGCLVDGRSAIVEHRKPVVHTVQLDLERPALLDLAGLQVVLGNPESLAIRAIPNLEAQTLLTLLRQAWQRRNL